MVNDWFYNECQNLFRPYGAIMMSPLRGYYDVAPTGLYCTPSEAEGWGYYDFAPLGLLIISATIFPLLITPGKPAPG